MHKNSNFRNFIKQFLNKIVEIKLSWLSHATYPNQNVNAPKGIPAVDGKVNYLHIHCTFTCPFSEMSFFKLVITHQSSL